MDPYRFNRFCFSKSQLAMAEHLEHHVTSQTRKDYLSFRGKNKICILPKYPFEKDLEKHIACLDVILSDWKNEIMPFKKELEDMDGHLNYLMGYDNPIKIKIDSLRHRFQIHQRRLDDYKATGEYKTVCFFFFIFTSFSFPQSTTSFPKRFCRDPNTIERKLSAEKRVFESIFFSNDDLYQDNTLGIRFDKPIRFIFKDNASFPNPALLIVEYSIAAIFEREIEPDSEEDDYLKWQMANFRIGLLKRVIKIEVTFVPSNQKVNESDFRANLVSTFPDQIDLSTSVDLRSIPFHLTWFNDDLAKIEHSSSQAIRILEDDPVLWFEGMGNRIFEILIDKKLLNTAEDVNSNPYFEPSFKLRTLVKAKSIELIKKFNAASSNSPIFVSDSIFDTISDDCESCGNTFYSYQGDGSNLINPIRFKTAKTKCEACKGNFIF